MIRTLTAAVYLLLFLIVFSGIIPIAQASSNPRALGGLPPRHPWSANTSGPFYTGTAEVEPPGSWYVEPYFFGNEEHSSTSDAFTQKMGIGMGHNLEFDALIPLTENTVRDVNGATGTKATKFGPGDTQLSFKYELTTDPHTRRLLARPAITLTANFVLPSGNAANLNPQLGGADQFGYGTYEEGLGVLVRKRFKPFVFYGQMNEMIADPGTVSKGYGYDNLIGVVTAPGNQRLVDGNILTYSGALEDVFNTPHGIGALVEVDGGTQSGRNLFFGKATAPSFSYVSMAPEVEFTWPAGKRFAITWGGGVNIPVERGNYPRVITPMATLTFYFNGPKGSRNSY